MDPEDLFLTRDSRRPGTRKGAADDWPRLVSCSEGFLDVDQPIEQEFGPHYLSLLLEGGASCSI